MNSKSSHIPIEIPIKNENGCYPIVYGSMIFFWSVALSYLSAWAAQASKQNFKKSVDPKWENGPILNIMAENDSNMIDLDLTHLTHPWGPD